MEGGMVTMSFPVSYDGQRPIDRHRDGGASDASDVSDPTGLPDSHQPGLLPRGSRRSCRHTDRMAMKFGRRLPLALAVIAIAAVGCGSSHHSSAPTTSIPPLTTVAPPTPAPSSTQASVTSAATTTTPATTSPAVRNCALSDLRISVTSPLGSAGTFHYQLIFQHISAGTCNLYGFPGVSFLDSRGKQIGPPAQHRTGASRQPVTLATGAQGYATLDITDPGIPPCAGPGTVAEIRVYPPGSYQPASVAPAAGTHVCASPNTANYTASTVGPVAATPSPGYNP
jgi:hypothetical protein